MRSALTIAAVLAFAGSSGLTADAQTASPKFDYERWISGAKLREAAYLRAVEIEPARRDGPLRYLNISDEEIREVEAITAKVLPRATVNISPVVTGCPCEEGPACTDQLYVVALKGDITRSVQLSRVKDVWQVGIVQEWWWRYAGLKAKEKDLDWTEYVTAWDRLARQFPKCANLASVQTAEVTQ
jgi:hypothetical protein